MATPPHWLLKLLAAVGALALLVVVAVFGVVVAGFGFAKWSDSVDIDVKIQQKIESPSREYVAVAATYMAGGAAGSCQNYVIVRRVEDRELPKTFREVETEAVFSVRCASNIALSWPKASGLHVRFNVPPGRSGTAANLQQLHGTLPVQVTYEIGA